MSAAPSLEWRDFAELPAPLLYELLRFRQAIFVVEQHSPYADLDGFDQAAHHLLLRRGDRVVVGCLRLVPHPAERRAAIGRVAVAAAERGRDLARQMMAAALVRCRADFAGWRVTLAAQSHLAPFYAGFGFAAVSAAYDDGGIAHIDMALCG